MGVHSIEGKLGGQFTCHFSITKMNKSFVFGNDCLFREYWARAARGLLTIGHIWDT